MTNHEAPTNAPATTSVRKWNPRYMRQNATVAATTNTRSAADTFATRERLVA